MASGYPPQQQGYPPQQPGYPPQQPGYPPQQQGYPPQQAMGVAQAPGQWQTGFCACFDDVGLSLLTCCCGCITFGRIAEVVDSGMTTCGTAGALMLLIQCFTGCGCVYSCGYRTKLRRKYNLPEDPCNDFLVHCCCMCCAMVQEHQELKKRGLDPALGWQPQIMQQAPVAMSAPVQQPMYK